MNREQATNEAKAIARRDGVTMAVTFEPYMEELDEAQKYGFMPLEATHIFKYEKTVETIRPPGEYESRRAVEFESFGSVFWLEDGTLMGVETNTYNDAGGTIEACDAAGLTGDITAPESQEFLDVINAVFGTSFKFEEFAGR